MFTEFEYLTAVREFLLTCTHPAPINLDYMLLSTSGIDYGEIAERRDSDRFGGGTAIMMTGDSIVSRKSNVLGEETHSKRVNFVVVLWRPAEENEFRRNIANFLNQLINWINEENARRYTSAANPMLPRFSNFEDGVDVISSDGGLKTATLDGGRAEFQIQVHCDYMLTY